MSLPEILAGISTFEKFAPVVHAVADELQPLVHQEIADGHAIWADVEKAIVDLEAAFSVIKTAAQTAADQPK